MIKVSRMSDLDPMDFQVTVQEGSGTTRHSVTLSREDHRRMTGDAHTPEHCVEAALRFLLDREPKESILRRFDVSVITRYFPDFEHKLSDYL